MGWQEMSAVSSESLNDQIQHHLGNWQAEISYSGYSITLHLDTIFVSVVLITLISFVFYRASQKLKLSPSYFQNFLESIIDVTYKEVAAASPHYIHTIGPLGLTVFLAILVMNLMDLFPTTFGFEAMSFLGYHQNFKAVPTADLNATLAFAVLVMLIINGAVIRYHGFLAYLKGWLAHPLGIAFFPANIFMRLAEEISRVISLAMRLYGNMFAGEVVFVLLSFAPLWLRATGVFGWCLFHILIIYLQAFIFMMLTVIGFSLALDH
jgi:F-type H+-transporting ATPase subunit a